MFIKLNGVTHDALVPIKDIHYILDINAGIRRLVLQDNDGNVSFLDVKDTLDEIHLAIRGETFSS